MRRISALVLTGLFAAAGLTVDAAAQGVQTGGLRGLVTDSQDLPVPGVAVTVRSEALQGTRDASTETDGTYLFLTLPPGGYVVSFEIAGFASIERAAIVPLGGSAELDVVLQPAGVAEEVQVVGAAPRAADASVGLNVTQDVIETLATSRTLFGITTLSPGLNENTPNAAQVSISGAFAYDNLFMLNGVDVNDNLFGSPQNLFIEDAIAETQVITSGLTAEYGRFTGGVINAITKSGGNRFEGSYRLNFTNPSWTGETPFEEDNDIELVSDLNLTHEMTFGGPLVRDRLWFFGAGRFADVTTAGALPVTGFGFETEDRNRRGEIKITGTAAPSQTFQGGYLNNLSESSNAPSLDGQSEIDLRTFVNDQRPNWYTFLNYRGVLGSRWLGEAQYSERRFRFEEGGGTSRDLRDSPIFTADFLYLYNAPFFDATDPHERNNRQLTANVTRFVEGAGRHEAKAGYEFFRSQIRGGGGQSSTDFVFFADFLANADGSPVLDESGRFIPVWVPFSPELSRWSGRDNWRPVRGARLNINTHSVFVQDHWTISRHLTADVGFRYERVRSDADGLVGADTDTIVPRVAVAFDPVGDGRTTLNATYGHYAGRYNEATFSANGNVGQPNLLLADYVGPPGQGLDFAPAFDPANYEIFSGRFPTANVSFAPGLSAPVVRELTLSAAHTFENGVWGEVSYVWRDTTNLIEDFTDRSNGITEVEEDGQIYGPFTNTIYDNTDLATRSYQGLVFQGNYRIRPNWTASGHWTIQLRNEGNYEGEASGQPGLVSVIADFPEVFSEPRHYPTGRLQSFQRHRVRVWSIYNMDLARWGAMSISGLFRVESARVYSLASSVPFLSPTQFERLFEAGYPDSPSGQTIFFGDRGGESFTAFGALDVSANYNIPVWRRLSPWIKIDLFNVLNNRKMIAWNTTILPDFESEVDELGLSTAYVEDLFFGDATRSSHYVTPRAFRMAVGFRF